jgi:hypothetical protein
MNRHGLILLVATLAAGCASDRERCVSDSGARVPQLPNAGRAHLSAYELAAQASVSDAAVEELVRSDWSFGVTRLLCSSISAQGDMPMEVPGLSQAEVDRLTHDYAPDLESFIHDGHYFEVVAEGQKPSVPSYQDRLWAFAERYNRCALRLLSSSGTLRAQKPNQSSEPTATGVTPPARAGDRAAGSRGSP